ncbi:MAG: PEP-CTERM sorting domain-containing protein [Acidobacteriaceae bacterium]
MKVFLSFIALVLLCGFSSVAGASSLDFKMGALDAPTTSFFNITGTAPFDITFSNCPSFIPNGDGCFLAVNDTPHLTFTSLTMSFPTNQYIAGQNAACDTTNFGSSLPFAFTSDSCKLEGTNFLLNFFGGPGISPGQTLDIVESGVPYWEFPQGTGTVGIVPEPSSVVLMATGLMLMFGFFFATGRGRQALESSL